jgi:aldose 1-epimerase
MPERYAVRMVSDLAYGEGVYELLDGEAGSSARVAPAAGNNLFSLRVPIAGRGLEVFLEQKEPRRGFPFGTPILFPYPGRVRDGRFSFGGQQHQLDVAPRMGHAIHGLVMGLPWKVEEAGATPQGARVVASLASADHPEVERQWPFPFRISIGFTLSGGTVLLEAEATNVGEAPMPLGFGIHPWFRLPLVESGARERCLLRVPARRLWEVEPDILPTGQVLDLLPGRDFRTLRPLGEATFDDTFTDVMLEDGQSECLYRDPAAGAEIAVRADAGFREMIVYAPPHLPAICLEPYTCVPDALNLQPRGLDAGLIVLEPGATWLGKIWIAIREI